MIVTQYRSSLLKAEHVQVHDGEVLACSDTNVNSRAYGIFICSGGLDEVVAEGDTPVWGSRTRTGNFQLNSTTDVSSVRAVGETSWVCISQSGDTRKVLTQAVVNSSTTLPAGSGFFVLEGAVQVDAEVLSSFQFFSPRDRDVEVHGSGTLILVR